MRTSYWLVLIWCSLMQTACAAQTKGYWSFQHAQRPVKAVAIGDSIMAFPFGSYTAFLQAACPNLEVVNRAKTSLGAVKLHTWFVEQVVRNPRLRRSQEQDIWLLYQGGLNGVEAPELTNEYIRRTFVAAHQAGLNVLGVSLLPWGSDKDRRWRGVRGLRMWQKTRLVVDFVMGRLAPKQALGSYAKRHASVWQAEEQADIAVDVYDSPIRDHEAPLRKAPRMHAAIRRAAWLRPHLRALPPEEKTRRIAAYVQQSLEIPRWYIKRHLRAIDHFHLNREGHRIVAQLICEQAPPTWGCECQAMRQMTWSKKRGRLTPVVRKKPES